MRYIFRFLLFFIGLFMIGIALAPYAPDAKTDFEPLVAFANSELVWAIALPTACFYSFARAGYVMQLGKRLRTCELLIGSAYGSLLAMPLMVVPSLNPLPPGMLAALSAACVFVAGVSMVWMQTFSGRLSRAVYPKAHEKVSTPVRPKRRADIFFDETVRPFPLATERVNGRYG